VALGLEAQGGIRWLDAEVESREGTDELLLHLDDDEPADAMGAKTDVIVFVQLGPHSYAFTGPATPADERAIGGECEVAVTLQPGVSLYHFQRRGTARVPVLIPLAAHVPGLSRGEVEGEMLDISLGGAQIWLARADLDLRNAIAARPRLGIGFKLDDGMEIRAHGVVVWDHLEQRRTRGIAVGLRWIDLPSDTEERIRVFLQSARRDTLKRRLGVTKKHSPQG
jgi:hypothetical protein